MDDEPTNILGFPGPPGPPPDEGVPWPLHAVELQAAPAPAGLWLEEEVSAIYLRALRFHLATARLDRLDRAVVGPLIDDVGSTLEVLLRALEILRLREPRRGEVLSVQEGIRRAAERLRGLRGAIVDALEPVPRRRLHLREGRTHVDARRIEDALMERADRRQVSQPAPAQALRLGDMRIPAPRPEEVSARMRRQWRAELDARPVDPDATLRDLLAALPGCMLEGVALRVLGEARGADVTPDAVAAELLTPRVLRAVLLSLPHGPRRILEALLEAGGVARYDLITHPFGPDDETGWSWAVDPPRTDLERLRRAGLVYAGTAPLDGAPARKVAVVPRELRDTVAALLHEMPPPPVPLRPDAPRGA